jgi:effector-binding domain-containing protein
MLGTPEIHKTTAQDAAVIHLTMPRSEIRKFMGPAIEEVMRVVAAQGIKPTGWLFSRHLKLDPETFDFEVGIPIAGVIEPSGRVKAGELPGRRVARAIYQGPYEEIRTGWGELEKWIRANGHTPGEGLWECYIKGPESGPDATQWKTGLNRPLRD